MVSIDMDMPESCVNCPMCMIVYGVCAYCMAGRFQVEYLGIDLRDGRCPLGEVKTLKVIPKYTEGQTCLNEINKLQTYKMSEDDTHILVNKEDVLKIIRGEK